MWLVRFHGFPSETGQALSYQRAAEADESVKEREAEGRDTSTAKLNKAGGEFRKESESSKSETQMTRYWGGGMARSGSWYISYARR